HQRRSPSARGRRNRSARLAILVQPAFYEPTDLFVLRARQSGEVGLARLVATAEPAKHVCAREVERQVAFENARALDAVEELQGLGRVISERDRNGSIQFDDGRSLVTEELIVEHSNLTPVRFCRGL